VGSLRVQTHPHTPPCPPPPLPELEGRSSDVAHHRLVQSAVEGGFNTFRLWGGGIFQYDAWYDACDEMGVLICA
jgi:beta-mannosidase